MACAMSQSGVASRHVSRLIVGISVSIAVRGAALVEHGCLLLEGRQLSIVVDIEVGSSCGYVVVSPRYSSGRRLTAWRDVLHGTRRRACGERRWH